MSSFPLILLLALVPVAIALIIITVVIFQLLWNSTIPKAFENARTVNFWTAFRLLLIGLMFSSGITFQFGR